VARNFFVIRHSSSIIWHALPSSARRAIRRLMLRMGVPPHDSGQKPTLPENLLSVSQGGQDYWVYGEAFNEMTGGYFVDIGAHDGISKSNTYLLEKRYSWKGLCVEANPLTFRLLTQNRSCCCVNACIDAKQRKVKFALKGYLSGIVAADCDNKAEPDYETVEIPAQTLVSVLEEVEAPQTIEYLTVDIEGAEDRALMGFPFDRFQFKCLTIERPSAALRAKLVTHGYRQVKEIPWLDCFFIHSSFANTYHQNAVDFHEKKKLLFKRVD